MKQQTANDYQEPREPDNIQERTISHFLQILVDRGTISQNIAVILNRLPSVQDQSIALNRLRDEVHKIAINIVNEIISENVKKPIDIKLTYKARKIIPNWLFYPYTDNLNEKIDQFVNKNPSLIKKIADLTIAFLSIILIFKLSSIIIRNLNSSEKKTVLPSQITISQAPSTQVQIQQTPSGQIAVPNTSLDKKLTTKEPFQIAGRETSITKHKQKIRDNDISTETPYLLRYHKMGALNYRISWKISGNKHKFHLYSSRTEKLNELKREDVSPLEKQSMDWTAPETGTYWFVVTTIDQNGRQGHNSPALKVVIK